jgi:hypothetical protein
MFIGGECDKIFHGNNPTSDLANKGICIAISGLTGMLAPEFLLAKI